MNRIDRLHAILTHLQSKRLVTAQEIADRFNISLRTVYRDVKALDESGVPVIGEAGSGYTIMEGYRLPPVMFTQEEAAALLLGGKLAAHMTDDSVKKHFETALFKIKAVLRSTDKDQMDILADHIEILRSRVPEEETPSQHLTALQKAIADKRAIFILYYSNYNEQVSERVIEPIGLCHYSANWHLIGWCRLRNGYRDFRVSRIKRLQIKDEQFDIDAHPSLKEYIETMTHESDLQEVVVRFDKDVVKYLGSQKYWHGFVREEEEAGFVRMHFVTSSLNGFGRWLLMYTNTVRVESPASLQTMMQQFCAEMKDHYQ
ncbi:YafY family transcriptional regulator [Pseudoflavitalea sp. X16]|uniref:helix-turn-helix transcriptional regulator n=1 Tax=Paraflavitalea devenefica TaxID=2716334 RepID=UPI00141FCB94|nr:YafY family protein [Paraflavitalea devenefica]NII24142.1 YafY family transcriptional regulator [Paraflavitalea devenefica]